MGAKTPRIADRGSRIEGRSITAGGAGVRAIITVLIVLLLAGGGSSIAGTGSTVWKQAIDSREWRFPQDHGAHPAFRTEWWYFTGNLSDQNQRRYGYQLTFFRQGIRFDPSLPANSWSVRDIYLAHFTITDIDDGRFHMAERASRTGPGLAGAATERLHVWLLNWSAGSRSDGVILLEARDKEKSIRLELRARKPVVLHGKNGLSRKGPLLGQASYYASLTDLATSGTLTIQGENKPIPVRGTSWFDHEFGSNQLSSEQVGWDWFGLHLSDGRDLMLYLLRRQDGTVDAASGTIVEPDGRTKSIGQGDMTIEATGRWTSPRSGGVYPARWKIRIPGHKVSIHVESLVADQELITSESTGITYWEGAIAGKGESNGGAVTCEGYAELTGYAGSLKGTF